MSNSELLRSASMVLRSLVCSFAAVAVTCGSAQAQAEDRASSLEAGIGLDYSSGEYGEDVETEMIYAPLSLRYATGPWTAEVVVPFLRLDGPAAFTITQGQAPGPAPQEESEVEAGLGDILVGLGYSFEGLYEKALYIDLTAKVKLPTADEDDGLGTARVDYIFQLDVARTFGAWTPTAMAGYRVVGRNNNFDLQNTALAAVGAQYSFLPTLVGGLSYEYRQSLSRDVDDPREILTYMYVDSGDWALTVYGVIGLSDGSPEMALGSSLTIPIF